MENSILCDYPFTHFEVNNPNGDVNFCCNSDLIMGNVNKNTITEIWNGREYQKARKIFIDGEIFKICSRDCPVLHRWKDYEGLDWYNELPKDSSVYKNAQLNEMEIAIGKVILESYPRWLRFSTSYKCNLKCYHCFQEKERKKNEVLPDVFFNELDNYLDKLQILFFFGGEPLIEDKNIKLMDKISRAGYLLKYYLVSNGTILYDEMKNIFQNLNFGLIDLSIDSVNKELYEELRYPAKWENTLSNIIYYSELSKKKNARFHICLTINKKNRAELRQFVEFCQKNNAMPFFQFANNVFLDKKFRSDYEIYSKIDFQNTIEELKKIKGKLRDKEYELSLLDVDHMIEFSENKLHEKTLLGFCLKTLKRIKRKLTN